MCHIQLGKHHGRGDNIDEDLPNISEFIALEPIQVKNKLRDLGKHGRFQIESVKDTSQDFKSTIQRSGRWERTVSKTSTFQLFP